MLLLEALNDISCFGIETDGSNHYTITISPILIVYFGTTKDGLITRIIELKFTPKEKAGPML